MNLTLAEMARLLGGEVSGGQILCPGPDHRHKDRSLAVRLNAKGNGIVVHSFSGDDIIVCKDHVRAKLGLPPFTPNKKTNGKGRKAIVATYDYTMKAASYYFRLFATSRKTSASASRTARGSGRGSSVTFAVCCSNCLRSSRP